MHCLCNKRLSLLSGSCQCQSVCQLRGQTPRQTDSKTFLPQKGVSNVIVYISHRNVKD